MKSVKFAIFLAFIVMVVISVFPVKAQVILPPPPYPPVVYYIHLPMMLHPFDPGHGK